MKKNYVVSWYWLLFSVFPFLLKIAWSCIGFCHSHKCCVKSKGGGRHPFDWRGSLQYVFGSSYHHHMSIGGYSCRYVCLFFCSLFLNITQSSIYKGKNLCFQSLEAYLRYVWIVSIKLYHTSSNSKQSSYNDLSDHFPIDVNWCSIIWGYGVEYIYCGYRKTKKNCLST